MNEGLLETNCLLFEQICWQYSKFHHLANGWHTNEGGTDVVNKWKPFQMNESCGTASNWQSVVNE
jgi:hypothetical protein